MFNAIFNNIAVISWQSVLLVQECCIEYTPPWARFWITTLVVICIDCRGSC